MSYETFIVLSLDELQETFTSHNKLEGLKRTQRIRELLTIARWQVFKMLTPPDQEKISIFDIEIFPWEKQPEDQPGELNRKTKEYYQSLAKKWS